MIQSKESFTSISISTLLVVVSSFQIKKIGRKFGDFDQRVYGGVVQLSSYLEDSPVGGFVDAFFIQHKLPGILRINDMILHRRTNR